MIIHMMDGSEIQIGDSEVDYVAFPWANLKVDPRHGVLGSSEGSDPVEPGQTMMKGLDDVDNAGEVSQGLRTTDVSHSRLVPEPHAGG